MKQELIEKFSSYSFSNFTIVNIYKNSLLDLEEEIINFWVENNALDLERAKVRVKEVVFIILDENRDIVGVYTAFPKEFIAPQNFFMFLRIFIKPSHRGSFGLRLFLHQLAFKFFKEAPFFSTPIQGLAVEMENVKYKREGYSKYMHRNGFTYYGLNPIGQQMWYVRFDDPKGKFIGI